jgi:hypothetical protein
LTPGDYDREMNKAAKTRKKIRPPRYVLGNGAGAIEHTVMKRVVIYGA